MRKIFIAAIIFVISAAYASFEAVAISPNSIRTGNISGFKKGDVLIPYLNYESDAVFGNYLIPFGLTELAMQEFSYFGKLKNYPFLITASNFGNEDYRENTVSVSAGVYSDSSMVVSPAVKYMNLKDAIGNKMALGIDLSASYSFKEKINALLSVINLYSTKTDEIDIPMLMMFNFEYKGIESFNLYTGVEKDSKHPATFKTGLEYAPFEFFSFSAGYNFDPELITSGFSLEYKQISFNYGMSYHFDLEYSHSLGLIYEF